MTQTPTSPTSILSTIQQAGARKKSLPQVHKWNPPLCEGVEFRIARDGAWFYMGSPVGRKAMVQLFSTVLRHDDDDCYYLVTPVEKVLVRVEDAPFLAVLLDVEGSGEAQRLCFTTNVDDQVTAGPDNPLRVHVNETTLEPAPYLLVRDRLEALISRPVFYQLVDMAIEREIDGQPHLVVWSSGQFFSLGTAQE